VSEEEPLPSLSSKFKLLTHTHNRRMPRPNPQFAITNLLTTRQNKAGSAVISQYDYNVNLLGQRSAVSQTGTAFSSARSIAWGYDFLGQVITADRSYQYDAQSRRIAKTTGTNKSVFLYNGWNSIADYSLASNQFTLQKTRLWGTDLSGSMQGAGGVGGLLLITDHSALITSHYPLYDGNGNVSEYLTTTGTLAAHYEYDPFGNTVVNTDTGNLFTYKFSTKPADSETGLYYYGYRYYDPMTGRWPNRDPIAERGGINLFGFVGNDGISRFDILGTMTPYGWGPKLPPTPTGPHGGQDDGTPTMGDHTAGHDPNEYLAEEDWFESNHRFLIQGQKDEAKKQIDRRIDCDQKKNWAQGYSISYSFGDLVLGQIAIKTDTRIDVSWDGKNWSWTATLSIYDKLGIDYTDDWPEFALTIFGGPTIAPPVSVVRARWEISSKGCCDK
jgi:RHS repeat-associated protein